MFCYIFHLDDFPSTEDLIEHFTSLFSSHTKNNKSINEEQDTSNSLTSIESLKDFMEPEPVIESQPLFLENCNFHFLSSETNVSIINTESENVIATIFNDTCDGSTVPIKSNIQ